MNFFTLIFQGFQLDFKLLIIVLFLGIISWKSASRFNGLGLFFRCGGLIFKWGVHPMEGIGFDRGVSKKNSRMEGHPHASHLGKPCDLDKFGKVNSSRCSKNAFLEVIK